MLLHELDAKLMSRGIRAVRYADDAVIFAKSRNAAERILTKRFLEEKLYLKVNDQKTKILRIGSSVMQFLGFCFTTLVGKQKRERYPAYKYFPVIHRKKQQKLKEDLRALLERKASGGISAVQGKLRRKLKG
ncbi:reverse transcriptase domain-containing protein [uncultured Parasutterella sp.]|uniref:reverse transcriptase domain-containing protein n=2 Tax=uncultured Parasutterella sp. TaxID=1263098 RepID=UPI0027298F2F|nr:reverse transcriptase domain-containing protein [uncultured Parasutterella sp.]